jgi:hypothetical protein
VALAHVDARNQSQAVTISYGSSTSKDKLTLSASPKHLAYVYQSHAGVHVTASIQFSRAAFFAVPFDDIRVGDTIGVYTGSADLLSLSTVKSVRRETVEGAYVVLLEDGGSPIIESALMSMLSLTHFSEARIGCTYG